MPKKSMIPKRSTQSTRLNYNCKKQLEQFSKENTKQECSPQKRNKIYSKIRLSDLCLEQKAKVGQLITALQSTKEENQNLTELLQQRRNTHQKQISQMSQLLSIASLQTKSAGNRVQYLLHEMQTLKTTVESLKEQIRQLQKLISQQNLIQKSQFTTKKCTSHVHSKNVQTQVQLNPPTKQRQLQTQSTIFHQFQMSNQQSNGFYRGNSKSFEKIMGKKTATQFRMNQLVRKQQQKAESRQIGQKSHYSINKLKRSARKQRNLKDSQVELDNYVGEETKRLMLNEIQDDQQGSQGLLNEQNEDFNEAQVDEQQFKTLAQKYLQMKERQSSQQKSKKSNKNSKKYNTKKLKIELEDSQNKDDRKVSRFSSHISSQSPQFQNKNYVLNQPLETFQDIDDQELNRILKSKNFSASRLLLYTNPQQSQNESRSNSRRRKIKEMVKKERKLKKGIDSNSTPQEQFEMKAKRAQNREQDRKSKQLALSNRIDFYETHLLDIVANCDREQ